MTDFCNEIDNIWKAWKLGLTISVKNLENHKHDLCLLQLIIRGFLPRKYYIKKWYKLSWSYIFQIQSDVYCSINAWRTKVTSLFRYKKKGSIVMATSLIGELLWTFAHSFTFIDHLSATRTCGSSPTNVVHPWCPRFVLSDSSFCFFGSRFSCLPSCSPVLISWVFYNSGNWPWALSNLIGDFLTSATRESGIWEIFACELLNPGLWIPEYSLRNPKSH